MLVYGGTSDLRKEVGPSPPPRTSLVWVTAGRRLFVDGKLVSEVSETGIGRIGPKLSEGNFDNSVAERTPWRGVG